MDARDGKFQNRLLDIFGVEAQEHVEAMSKGLFDLEKAASQESRAGILETIFRRAHTLKGAARAVGAQEMESLCQALESVFSTMRKTTLLPSASLLDLLHETVVALSLGSAPRNIGAPTLDPGASSALIARLEDAAKHPEPGPAAPGAIAPPLAAREQGLRSDTIRVSKAKLNEMLLRAEELIPLKQNAEQLVSDLRDLQESAASLNRSWIRLRQDVQAVRQWSSQTKDSGMADRPRVQLHRMSEFLDRNQSFVEQMEKALQSAWKSADQNSHSLRGTGDSLLRDARMTLMLPISSLFEVLPTFVREIARDQGKDVELVLDGPEVEVDQRILEEAKDCFIQLVRNSIGHGIERAEARLKQGKPARGRIGVKVAPEVEGGLTVDFSDDGAGIDARKILAAGLEQGIVTPAAAEGLSEREILSLIFQSGISTSPVVTELAGRGLGLAIVWEKLNRLGGSISLESHSPLGTTFRIRLPLAMATFRGLLIRSGDGMFVTPTSTVERVTGGWNEGIRTLGGREVVPMAGQSIPLVPLSEVLGLPIRKDEPRSRSGKPVMVLGGAGKSIAFLVDEVLGELEVLVKGLGPQLSRVRNIAGATILGSGKVVFILNVPDLMKSALRHVIAPEKFARQPAPLPAAAAAPDTGSAAGGERRILVVDDSITYRNLLKDILENRGFQVATAVDGLDAMAKLRDAAFGAVLADVDMPRLDGFGLTARIRSEGGLSGLPVILVTALESPQDLSRGMDSGANAYVVKSSLDPNGLVETLERFL